MTEKHQAFVKLVEVRCLGCPEDRIRELAWVAVGSAMELDGEACGFDRCGYGKLADMANQFVHWRLVHPAASWPKPEWLPLR